MNKFNKVKSFFRQYEPGEFLVRSMYMDTMRDGIGESVLDIYRCYFQKAGYIYNGKKLRNRGVYFFSKPIPQNLTLYELIKEAYPNRNIEKIERKLPFYQEFQASETLALITGMQRGFRTEFYRGVLSYIKKNNLLRHHKQILSRQDENLRKLCSGRRIVNTFTLIKFINEHLTKSN